MPTKFNLSHIVAVDLRDFEEDFFISYKKQIKIFGFTIRKQGVYGNLYGTYHGVDIPKNHSFIGGIYFNDPNVTLNFTDGSCRTYYFKTFFEASKFYNTVTNCGNWF